MQAAGAGSQVGVEGDIEDMTGVAEVVAGLGVIDPTAGGDDGRVEQRYFGEVYLVDPGVMHVPAQGVGNPSGVAPLNGLGIHLHLGLARHIGVRNQIKGHNPAQFLLVPNAHVAGARGHQVPFAHRHTRAQAVIIGHAQGVAVFVAEGGLVGELGIHVVGADFHVNDEGGDRGSHHRLGGVRPVQRAILVVAELVVADVSAGIVVGQVAGVRPNVVHPALPEDVFRLALVDQLEEVHPTVAVGVELVEVHVGVHQGGGVVDDGSRRVAAVIHVHQGALAA